MSDFPHGEHMTECFRWNPDSSLGANAAMNFCASSSPGAVLAPGGVGWVNSAFIPFAQAQQRQPGVVGMTAAEVAARYPMPEEPEGAQK